MHGLSPNPPKREGLPPLSWERGIEGVRPALKSKKFNFDATVVS